MKAIKKAQLGKLVRKGVKKATEKTVPKKIVKNIDIKSAIRTSNKNSSIPTVKFKSGGTVKAKDGKWMQKAAASIKRRGTAGKCTPITKPGCTGKAKALAKTFKKIAKSNKKK